MRWLFLFLVFLNLFFYVWQQQQIETIPQTTRVERLQVPTIQLAKEYAAQIEKQEALKALEPQTIEVTKEPITCLHLGGFINSKQLTVVGNYIEGIDPAIKLDVIKPDNIPTVELYITPEEDQRQETLDKLQKLSINTLTILRGVLKNNISLGIFPEEKDYAEIKDALKNADIKTKTNKLPQSATSYWLKIPNNKRSLFTDEQLKTLINKFPTVQQELMLCQPPTKTPS